MIVVSNAAAQTLTPGQSLTFNVLKQTGCSEFARNNTGSIFLKPGGVYEVEFHANVTNAAAATAVQLSLNFAGSTLPETTSIYTPGTINAVGNVSGKTYVATVLPFSSFAVTLTNTGTTDVTVSPDASIAVHRIG